MNAVAALAILRGVVWTMLLYVAIRHRSRLSLLAVGLAWASNVLIVAGLPRESGIVGVATASLIVYLLIDRLDKNPVHVKHVAARQVTDARHAYHDALNEARAWEARYRAAERALRDRGIYL